MGADFHIRGDTKLDSSGFSKGIDKLGSAAKKGAATMQSSFQGAISVLDKVKSKFSSASSEADKFQKKTKETDPYLEKLKSTLKETDQELDKLTKAYREAVVEKGRYSKEAQELANKIKEAERKQSELRSEIEKSSDSFEDAAKDVKKYGSSLSDLKGKALSGLGNAAKVGFSTLVTAGAAAVGALGTAGVAAIKVGSDFEAAMSEVQAISGATGSDLEKLSDATKEMGATTKFSASESAEALKYMAMAGWDTEEMLNGLPGVINLAAASGEALGTVSDIVTDAMTAFGLSTEETNRFVDVLAQTANKSNTNVAMLGESFQYVAPVAGALGFSIEDTAVALGLMANSGIKASQAGTSLRTLFTNLTNPVGQSAKAIEALGISIQNSDGSMKSFSEIMGDLRGEFGKMAEAEKAQYAAMLAGQEGMSGLLAIVNASDSDFQDLAASIAQSNGAAEEMAQTMQNNLQGSITSFRSAAEGLGIAIYEGIKDKVKNTVDIGTDMLRQLREGFEQGGVEGLISAATNVVGQLLNGFVTAAPSLIDAGVQILMMVLNGIAMLIPTLPQQSQTIITALANGIFTLLPTLIVLGTQILFSLIQGFVSALPSIVESGTNAVLTLGDTIVNNLPQILESGTQLLLSLIQGIASSLPRLTLMGFELIFKLSFAIIQNLPQILDCGVQILAELIAGFLSMMGDWITLGSDLVQDMWNTITETDWLSLGSNIISGIANGIVNGAGAIVSAAQDAASRALNAAKNFLGIHSPSRVFRDEVGKMIPQGMAVGVETETDKAVRVTRQSAFEMLNAAKNTMISNQSRSPVLATADAPAVPRQTAATVQTQHTTVIEMDGRTVAKVITPFVDQFLF